MREHMTANSNNGFVSGLAGAIAAQTRLSHVDGQRGELILAGYSLEGIAPWVSFEEMVHLLWHDRLPTDAELTRLHSDLACWRALPNATLDLLHSAAQTRRPAMDVLRMAVGTFDVDSPETAHDDALLDHALLSRIPTAIAAYWRLLQGKTPVLPDPQEFQI